MAALAPSSCVSLRECFHKQHGVAFLGGRRRCASTVTVGGYVVESGNWRRGKRSRGEVKVGASRPDMSSRPMSMEMEAIGSAEELDEILEHAQEQSLVVILDWMADWCRKCIYLRPKLEKLAAEYYPRVRFYIVDVNKVPQTLVKRGNITKMPTIQLWKYKEWKDEVIGGHKAWEVINEVREMIHKHI